ncbi:MAG: tetratricopeptide repeat protein [Candidatus Thioglobus sp.]|nr:tetratricopeptide repeat protein [Candidatus Thioglobus sp.]
MRYFSFVLIVLLIAPASVSVFAIDTEAVATKNFTQIKQLKKANRHLLGSIEQLQQQQKHNQQKISELFRLLEYKSADRATKSVISRLENADRAAKKIYTNARNLLLSGQHQQALEAFQDYRKRFPENNQISDANYWLGKVFVKLEDYQNAKQTFIDFQANYALHAKFPNSLYELALVQNQLKNTPAAEKLLKTLIKKFPNHSISAKAKALLAEITTAKTDKIQAK